MSLDFILLIGANQNTADNCRNLDCDQGSSAGLLSPILISPSQPPSSSSSSSLAFLASSQSLATPAAQSPSPVNKRSKAASATTVCSKYGTPRDSQHSSSHVDCVESTCATCSKFRVSRLTGSSTVEAAIHEAASTASASIPAHRTLRRCLRATEEKSPPDAGAAGSFKTPQLVEQQPVHKVVLTNAAQRNSGAISTSSSSVASESQQRVEKALSLLTANKATILKSPSRSAATDRNGSVSRSNASFDWLSYLRETDSQAVPDQFFRNPYPMQRNGFKVGMLLEGHDPEHPTVVCVLSVSQILGYRIRLHFEGYDAAYDFWRCADSPLIYPVGHCAKQKWPLMPPYGLRSHEFEWSTYLIGKVAAPKHLFQANKANQHLANPTRRTATACDLQLGMKLEAVDRHNPVLVRVASVADVREAAGKQQQQQRVRVHYDGWPSAFDVWLDRDSDEMYAIGWCERTNHPLERPPHFNSQSLHSADASSGLSAGATSSHLAANGCPTHGCFGVGHVNASKYNKHFSESGCPYSVKNMNSRLLPDRLALTNDVSATAAQLASSSANYETQPILNWRPQASNHHQHHRLTTTASQKQEMAIRNQSKRIGRRHNLELNKSAMSTETTANAASAVCTTPYDMLISGLKRGRPRKTADLEYATGMKAKRFKSIAMSANLEPVSSTDEKKLFAEKKRHLLFQNEIRESVYLTNDYACIDPCATVAFKYDSQLVVGVESYACRPEQWNVDQVCQFIDAIPGCANLSSLFVKEQIDGEALLLVHQSDLIRIMKIKVGPALKIYNSILKLKFRTRLSEICANV